MKDFAELASTRRSIRKFRDADIPDEEIKSFIELAASAPSGCNSQCWYFCAVRDKNVKNAIADAVTAKLEAVLKPSISSLPEGYLASKKKMVTFFTAAPVVICVFRTYMDFYDPVFEEAIKKRGRTHDEMLEMLASPDLLSVGAAVQNLLLAVHEKGYGACWMNEPAIAGDEIAFLVGAPKGSRFISLVPVGVPQYTPREKKMKPLDEIFKSI